MRQGACGCTQNASTGRRGFEGVRGSNSSLYSYFVSYAATAAVISNKRYARLPNPYSESQARSSLPALRLTDAQTPRQVRKFLGMFSLSSVSWNTKLNVFLYDCILYEQDLLCSCGYSLGNKRHDIRLIKDGPGHRNPQHSAQYRRTAVVYPQSITCEKGKIPDNGSMKLPFSNMTSFP